MVYVREAVVRVSKNILREKEKDYILGENLTTAKIDEDQGVFLRNEYMGKCFLNYECECLHLLSNNPVLLISVYFQSPRMILGCLEIFIFERRSLKLLHCIQLFTFP